MSNDWDADFRPYQKAVQQKVEVQKEKDKPKGIDFVELCNRLTGTQDLTLVGRLCKEFPAKPNRKHPAQIDALALMEAVNEGRIKL